MKKHLVLLAFLVLLGALNATLLLEDNFTGTVSTLLTANGWTAHSGSGSNPCSIINDNLTYPSYLSQSGNCTATVFSGSAEDVNKTFTAQTSGSVYASFLIRLTSLPNTTTDYALHLGPSPIGSTFIARFHTQRDASNNVRFGIAKGTATPNYTGYSYALGTTYLIVVKYTIISGATNDEVRLFINPVVNGIEPTADLVNPDITAADPVNVGSIAIRQGSNTPIVKIDGIRVGTTWADVAAAGASAPTTQASAITFANVGQNQMDVSWTSGNGGKRIVIMNTTNSFTNPTDGTDPTADPAYDGAGEQVVYNNTGSSVTVTGLDESSTYWFRVYECNGSGASTLYLTTTATNNPNSQDTASGAVIPSVTTTAITAITNTSAYSGGNVTSDGGDAVTARGVCWNTGGTPDLDDDFTEDADGTGTYTSFIDGLAANQLYYVRAYATNGVGTAYGNEISFTTLKAQPTNHVSGFSAVLGTPSYGTIVLSWTDPTTGVIPDGYLILGSDIGFGSITAPTDGIPVVNGLLIRNVAAGIGTYTFTALAGSTTYYFYIFPYTNSGIGIDFKIDAPIPQASATTDLRPWVEDFEIGTKTSYTTGSATCYTGSWYFVQSLIGDQTGDIKNGLKSVRLRYDLTSGLYGSLTMNDLKTTGVGTVSFLYSRSNFANDRTGTAPSFVVEYAPDLAKAWTQVGPTTSLDGIDVLTLFTTDVNIPGDGRIRIRQVSGDASRRWNIDDIQISDYEEPPLPVELSSFTAVLSATNYVNLTWVTQTETGVQGYYIYRAASSQLIDAEMVSPMIAATNTSEQQSYVFTDNNLDASGTYYYWLQNVDFDGSNTFHGPVSVYYSSEGNNPTPEIPLVTQLNSIYPNPFNPATFIPFSIAESAEVSFKIYNSRGQIVKQYDLGTKIPGNYRIEWNGTDYNGQALANGVYYVKMLAGKNSYQAKAVLLK